MGPFKEALQAFYEQFTTYPINKDVTAGDVTEVEGESPTVPVVPVQQQHMRVNSMGYVHSSGMLLLTDRLPLPMQNTSDEGGDGITIHSSISSSPLVGRIAAETVRTL